MVFSSNLPPIGIFDVRVEISSQTLRPNDDDVVVNLFTKLFHNY